MSILLFDGFDHYPTDHTLAHSVSQNYYSNNLASYVADLVSGRFGGKAISFPSLGSIPRGLWRGLPAATNTIAMGIAFQPTASLAGMATDVILLAFQTNDNQNSTQICVTIGADGLLRVYRGEKTTLLATGTTVLSATNYYYIEFSAFIHDTTGTFAVAIDGAAEVSGSGVDTKQSASNDKIGVVFFGMGTTTGSKPVVYFDDLYLKDDLTFLGPCRVETLFPSSDTADSDFTPSTGADNYAVVDDAGTITDYVESNANADFDLYNISNLSSNPDDIFAAAAIHLVAKTEAGECFVKNVIKVGGTAYSGDEVGVSASPEWSTYQWVNNPATATPWTQSSLNAAQAGFERI